MPANQELKHASWRVISGTALSYQEDAMAAFAVGGVTTGTFNERSIQWLKARLSSSSSNLSELQEAFAVNKGALNWQSLGTFTV